MTERQMITGITKKMFYEFIEEHKAFMRILKRIPELRKKGKGKKTFRFKRYPKCPNDS